MKKKRLFFCVICLWGCLLAGCAEKQLLSSQSSGNPAYEQQQIIVTGDIEKDRAISVAELRQLPQKEVQGSFQRTTGMTEKVKGSGPDVKDVLARLGIDMADYKGIGFAGRDGYYCLVTPEMMQNTELILALAIDGKNELANDMRPARLCAEGEFGPYWVRMADKLILYKEIPKKEISSVWIFDNLTAGIEPYEYEYYGSQDPSIELAQIFSRFDNVNNRAFFTMKSADGFIKNEALNMVSKDYYIKIEGEGAPMNIAPNIKLGMNVKHIAWFSSNADAVVFPEQMQELIGAQKIAGQTGISLVDMLEEVQVRDTQAKQFELIGVNSENVKISARDLAKGMVVRADDGSYPVVWAPGTDLPAVSNLMRIRIIPGNPAE